MNADYRRTPPETPEEWARVWGAVSRVEGTGATLDTIDTLCRAAAIVKRLWWVPVSVAPVLWALTDSQALEIVKGFFQ